jgi:MoxR-like ATPase
MKKKNLKKWKIIKKYVKKKGFKLVKIKATKVKQNNFICPNPIYTLDLKEGEILFFDEIFYMPTEVAEAMYTILQNRQVKTI